ncbi:MAG: GHMP kinase [Acidobacteriota bacterium]
MKKSKAEKIIKTIKSHTPVRINDIGGWTDTWYSKKGKVLNTAVSPGVEVEIKVYENIGNEDNRVSVYAKNYEEIFQLDPDHPKYDQHPLLQASINSIHIPKDLKLEIKIHSPIPAGSSTGTSGSVCVALLGALNYLSAPHHSADELATLAHRVETEKLGWQSGIQDQICAAYGGVCFIDMYKYPKSSVSKLNLPQQVEKALNNRLCLIYLGSGHSSSSLHEEVIRFLEEKGSRFKPINKMRELAQKAKDFLTKGDLHSFGKIMIENNENQRSLHPSLISEQAESVIQIAKKHQALGWKVNGAGGEGGSLTLLSPKGTHQKTKMLEEINSLGKGIRSIPVSLNLQGLEVFAQR